MRTSFVLAILSLIGAPLILARPLPDSHDILARSIADAVVDALVQRDFDTRALLDRRSDINLSQRDYDKMKRSYLSRRAGPAVPAAAAAAAPAAAPAAGVPGAAGTPLGTSSSAAAPPSSAAAPPSSAAASSLGRRQLE